MLPIGIRLSILLLLAATVPVAIVDAAQKSKKKKEKGKTHAAAAKPIAGNAITPVPFRERNGKDVFNASGIVALGDSHFVFVDNNTNDALLELRLTADGQQASPIARLPLRGLAPGTVDDIEDLALAEIDGRRFIFATPSLSMKSGKKGAGGAMRPSALLRIEIGKDGTLDTEAMPDFREWFVRNVPAIAAAATRDPDAGGLNVEGLGWDPKRQALLIGVRTPLVDQLPIIVPVRIKAPAGPWTTSNLEALAPIKLHVERGAGAAGVRGVTTRMNDNGFLVVVANATSKDSAPFAVYSWDGLDGGHVSRFPHVFADGMKAEGLTVGTVGGKPVVVVVDDGGGFSVVWL